ncbi:hypothetical protein PTUN_a1199 [Pseudoalteromonas tunicata]|nr:hypothetical protein PTUN_a1199 [Pseudoalteromonas tunicata]
MLDGIGYLTDFDDFLLVAVLNWRPYRVRTLFLCWINAKHGC